MVYTEPNFQGTCQVHRESEEFLSERRTVQSCRVSGGRSVRSHSQNSGTITQRSAGMVWDSKSSLMIVLFQLFFFWLIIKCWSDHCLLSWFHFFFLLLLKKHFPSFPCLLLVMLQWSLRSNCSSHPRDDRQHAHTGSQISKKFQLGITTWRSTWMIFTCLRFQIKFKSLSGFFSTSSFIPALTFLSLFSHVFSVCCD